MAATSGAAHAGPIEDAVTLDNIPPICTVTDAPDASFNASTGELDADLTVGARCLGAEI